MFKTGKSWLDHYLRVFYSPDDGGGSGGAGGAVPAEGASGLENVSPEPSDGVGAGNDGNDLNAEIARMKADMARYKAAMDKATKEASDYKKQLRAKQSAEEIAAEEAKAAEEQRNNELTDLRKRFAVMETAKNVAVKLGGDDAVSGKIAEYLYGAEDADAVITEFQKILAAREKALRLEYGKVPGPGIGSINGEDEAQRAILDIRKKYGKNAVMKGFDLMDGATARQRNAQIGGHAAGEEEPDGEV